MWLLFPILITIHVLICLLMVLVVLMQRPRSEGLGAAFGGGMTDSLFGAQTTNVLAKFTVWLGIGFFAMTLLLAVVYAKSVTSKSSIQQELLAAPAVPQATATPAAPVAPATPAPSAEPAATPAPVVPVEAATPAPAPAAEGTPAPAATVAP